MQTKHLSVTIEKADVSSGYDARFIMSAATPDRVHYVYKLTARNPIDERKYYVGVRSCSGTPENDDYMGSSRAVDDAIASGVVFTKKILCTGYDRKQAAGIESALHKFYDAARNPEFFNQLNAGDHCPRTGKKHTEETKRKMSEGHKGKVLSEETRNRMSASRIGNTYNLGNKASDATKVKMSVAAKNFAITEEGRAAKSRAANARWEKHRNAS